MLILTSNSATGLCYNPHSLTEEWGTRVWKIRWERVTVGKFLLTSFFVIYLYDRGTCIQVGGQRKQHGVSVLHVKERQWSWPAVERQWWSEETAGPWTRAVMAMHVTSMRPCQGKFGIGSAPHPGSQYLSSRLYHQFSLLSFVGFLSVPLFFLSSSLICLSLTLTILHSLFCHNGHYSSVTPVFVSFFLSFPPHSSTFTTKIFLGAKWR